MSGEPWADADRWGPAALRRRLRPLRRWVRESRQPGSRRDRIDEENLAMLLAFTLRSDSSCVDVGANQGDVLAHFVRLAPEGHHVAFEPLPHLAASLRTKFPTVDVRAAAVADAAGESSFVHVPDAEAYSGLRRRAYPHPMRTEELRVPVVTLDESIGDDRQIDLVKIDVEGAEMGVLVGGTNLIRRCQPTVVFEHGQGGRESYSTTPRQVYDFFEDVGLRIFDLDGNGPYSCAMFEHESTFARWNWVAH